MSRARRTKKATTRKPVARQPLSPDVPARSTSRHAPKAASQLVGGRDPSPAQWTSVGELEAAVATLVSALGPSDEETTEASLAAADVADDAADRTATAGGATTVGGAVVAAGERFDSDSDPDGSLGSDPGDEDPERARPGWRRIVLVALLTPVCFGVGIGAAALGARMLGDEADRHAAPLTGLVTPTPPPVGGSASPSSAGSYVPGGSTGPGQTEPGVLVRAQASSDGSVDVVERVRFGEPAGAIGLALPSTRGMAPEARPRSMAVRDLQVAADGTVVTPPTVTSAASSLTLPDGTRSVELRYRLVGATTRSTPSVPGRALVVLPPLTTARSATGKVVVEVVGDDTSNLLCPGLAQRERLCGHEGTDRWSTPLLAPGSTAVVAQLVLPGPGD